MYYYPDIGNKNLIALPVGGVATTAQGIAEVIANAWSDPVTGDLIRVVQRDEENQAEYVTSGDYYTGVGWLWDPSDTPYDAATGEAFEALIVKGAGTPFNLTTDF